MTAIQLQIIKFSAFVAIAAVINGSLFIPAPAGAKHYPANNHFQATPYAPPRNYMSNQIQQHQQQGTNGEAVDLTKARYRKKILLLLQLMILLVSCNTEKESEMSEKIKRHKEICAHHKNNEISIEKAAELLEVSKTLGLGPQGIFDTEGMDKVRLISAVKTICSHRLIRS